MYIGKLIGECVADGIPDGPGIGDTDSLITWKGECAGSTFIKSCKPGSSSFGPEKLIHY